MLMFGCNRAAPISFLSVRSMLTRLAVLLTWFSHRAGKYRLFSFCLSSASYLLPTVKGRSVAEGVAYPLRCSLAKITPFQRLDTLFRPTFGMASAERSFFLSIFSL